MQHHYSLGKNKLKPRRETTTHLLELLKENLTVPSADEDEDHLEI